MEWDFEEVVAATMASAIGRFLLLLSAVWLGCAIATYSMVSWSEEPADPLMIVGIVVVSPILLFSSWAVLNVPFLIFYFFRFMREEVDGYWVYGLVVGVESIACLLGYGTHLVPMGFRFVACLALWLSLLVLVVIAIRKLRSREVQKSTREIEVVRETNARSLAEKIAVERERMSLEK